MTTGKPLFRSALLAGAFSAALAACGGPPDPRPAPAALPALPAPLDPHDPARGAARAPATLNLALVGEVRGEIEPCGCPTLPYGGFARRARLLADLAPEGPLFQLDAGELLLKGIRSELRADRLTRSALMQRLSAAVGVDVFVPGPSDLLALGVDGLRALRAGVGPKAISATLQDAEGRPLLPATAVVERGGLKLGVIGLSAAPRDAASAAQVRALDPIQAAQAALASLPSGLDLVVALGSVNDAEADAVAARVPGLAAVLTTRGARYDEPRVPVEGQAPVIEAPDRGRYVTVVRARLGTTPGAPLVFLPDAQDWRAWIARRKAGEQGEAAAALEARFAEIGEGRNLAFATAVPLGAEHDGPAPAVDDLIRAFKDEARQVAVSTAAAPVNPTEPGFAASGACVSCHASEFARWALTDHARAWESLTARSAGENPECVACHATGYGQPGGFGALSTGNIRKFKGVQCEACHGPLRGHPRDSAVHARPISADSCLGCHDEANSPSFDFETYLPQASCQGGAPDLSPPP